MTAPYSLFNLDDNASSDTSPEKRPPSKTQRKNAMHALQDLGDNLLKYLSPQKLAKLPLPEELLEALRQARSIKEREAKRRHSQYIGKLMRGLEQEQTDALQRILEPFIARKYRATTRR